MCARVRVDAGGARCHHARTARACAAPQAPPALPGQRQVRRGGGVFSFLVDILLFFLLNEVCVVCLPWDCMRRRTTHVRVCKAQKKKKSKSRAVWRCHQHTREGWGGEGPAPLHRFSPPPLPPPHATLSSRHPEAVERALHAPAGALEETLGGRGTMTEGETR